jgi:hypothetical protein
VAHFFYLTLLDSTTHVSIFLKESSVSEFVTSANAAVEPEKKKKKRGGLALIIGGAVLAAAVGGVFATNVISINSDNTIQLGNGVADAVSCTNAASTTVDQAWSATAGGGTGAFIVTDVKVTGVNALCSTKTLKVLLIQTDGTTMCSIDGSHATATTEANAQDQFTLTNDNTTVYTADLVGNQVPGECLAANVGKVGLETAN